MQLCRGTLSVPSSSYMIASKQIPDEPKNQPRLVMLGTLEGKAVAAFLPATLLDRKF